MRIRTVKPEFWMSERMCSLGAETRLLALGLLNYADDAGYFLAHPALIRGALMPFAVETGNIEGMLQELVGIDYLRMGEDRDKRRIGWVVNFKKHQVVNRPQVSKLEGKVRFEGGIPGVDREDSVSVPRTIRDDSVNVQGVVTEHSVNFHGVFTAGMEGNGMEKEGNREGCGKPSPDKPGGDLAALPLAGSSMQEAEMPKANAETVGDEPADGHGGSNSVIPDLAESAKKKEGAAAESEGGLHSTWCPQSAGLLEQVWRIIEPITIGSERFKVQVGTDHVEFAKYPEGWQIIEHGNSEIGYMGSSMNREKLSKLLTQLVKDSTAEQKGVKWRRSKPKKEEGPSFAKDSEAKPEFPLDLPVGYREPLTNWWEYKRERREGYKAKGWEALVRQQQRFPAKMVQASVECSMANNWAGLFTERQGEERSSLGQSGGAKKGRGAGPVMSDREPVMVVVDEEPVGWREAWGDVYPFAAPERWSLVPESNRRDVLAALTKGGKQP